MKLTASLSTPLPTGEYPVQITNIEPSQGNFGPQFKWTLEVIEPANYTGKHLTAWSSASPSLRGKCMKWISACLGRAVAAGESVDMDLLIGYQVTAVVTVKEGDDGEFNKVLELKPYRGAKKPPQPSTSADGDPFGDQ